MLQEQDRGVCWRAGASRQKVTKLRNHRGKAVMSRRCGPGPQEQQSGLAMRDLQHSTNGPAGAAAPLRIAGFGACMIAGWPHPDGGLLETACRHVEQSLQHPVRSRTTSLGSFPAPRAEKHLKRRALDFKPDYVVIQFGATDAQCPIRRKSSEPSDPAGNAREGFHAPNALTIARWEIASLINFLLKTPARTPLPAYVEAVGRMADSCILDGATPIVLSPFVFGSRYSTRNAALFTNALRELQARKQPMILIDCVRLLSNFSRSKILLNDGFHLSRMAHTLIGEAVGETIVADVIRAGRPVSESGDVSAASWSSAVTDPAPPATRTAR